MLSITPLQLIPEEDQEMQVSTMQVSRQLSLILMLILLSMIQHVIA